MIRGCSKKQRNVIVSVFLVVLVLSIVCIEIISKRKAEANNDNSVNIKNDKYSITVSEASEWKSSSSYGYTVDTQITNTSKENINGWKIVMKLPSDVTIDGYWCSNCTYKDRALTITNVDYNKIIKPGEKTKIGFKVGSKSQLDLRKVTLTFNGQSLIKNTVATTKPVITTVKPRVTVKPVAPTTKPKETAKPVTKVEAKTKLIYINEDRMQLSKNQILKGNSYFKNAYNLLISDANKELSKPIDPVTNKKVMPQSGDVHDYLSIGPYYWPNPNTKNGLPWINKDGQVNPQTRGSDTDQTRMSAMLSSINKLSMAYYFSKDVKYANKAKQIINAWFLNDSTKVNPNINYGQGVPGAGAGRPFGIIEWCGISQVVTAMQLLERDNIMSAYEVSKMKTWFSQYLTWLRTSTIGKGADNTTNNHGTNYDYQVVGIMIYLGKIQDAEAKLNEFKTKRIASQISTDGSQPRELDRTKSVNYSTMNLWAMSRVADIGRRFTSVDLWKYKTNDGRSIRLAYDFLKPYVLKQKTWKWQQIIGGGAQSSIDNLAKPMFSRAGTIFNETLIDSGVKAYSGLSYMDILLYPPKEMY